MKRKSKLICSILLITAVLAGTVFSGCANTTDYTQEIKEYQEKLESLQAENEQLKAQLGISETESAETESFSEETESETENETVQEETASEQETVSEQESQTAESVPAETETQTAETESEAAQETYPEAKIKSVSGVLNDGGVTNILVLGDSIWGNDRDETGVAAKVDHYLERLGYTTNVYNVAIGGTRASIDWEDNEWEYGPGSDNSLGKMTSILNGDTDVEQLRGIAAYEVVKEVLEIRDQIDLVILAYGMNDFLSQAEINNSDRHWTGYGTALGEGITAIKRACPDARIMIIAPTYASYFSIPIQNWGEKALYNYASVACDVALYYDTLCLDAYNKLGIDAYNEQDYLEDGVHLTEAGRDLYARAVVGNLVYGQYGQISGNAMPADAFE